MADSVERLEFDIYARDRGAKRTFDEVARGADKAGDSFDSLGKDSGHLDKAISETEQHLKALIEEFNKTDDVTLLKEVRRDRSTLSLLESMRKKVEQIANETQAVGGGAGSAAALGIGDALGAIPSRLKGAAIVGAIAAAPVVAPVIGAAIGGAVLGAVGAGGIVGGIAAAAQDERVKNAGQELGENFVSGAKDIGRIFVNPILDQVQTLKHAEDIVVATLGRGFARLAPTVRPLALNLEEAARAIDPGLTDAFDAAAPAVRALGNELPEIAATTSDFFSTISEEKDGAIFGLVTIVELFESQLTLIGNIIAGLSSTYEWMVRTGDSFTGWSSKWLGWIPIYGDLQKKLHGGTQELISDLGAANDAGDDWRGNLAEQARAAREAADAAKQYEDAIDSLFNKILGLKDAQLRYNQDLLKLRAELKEGAKTLSINTEEGQKNQAVILAQIRDIKALRDEHIANNFGVERSNQLYEQQMKQLIDLAVQMGFDRKEVENFAGALRDVPDQIDLQIVAHGLSPSLNHAIQLDKYMDKLDGRVVQTKFVSEFADYRSGERELSRRAVGGPQMAGRAYLVGENGPEIRYESTNGYIHTAAETRAMLSGASGGSAGPARPQAIQVEGRVVLDVAGAHDALGQAIAQMLRVDPGFRATVKSYIVEE